MGTARPGGGVEKALQGVSPRNLYVHFPFCRRKCTYCALHSRAGIPPSARNAYVQHLANTLSSLGTDPSSTRFDTVYFGGGSPALCDLNSLFHALSPRLAGNTEFTVELHPLDVTDDLLLRLRDGGVNRISMGVQSLDDATLHRMGRGYTVKEASRAFATIRSYFENSGIDLIVGYPGDPCDRLTELADWGLAHCSAYSLILEEHSILGHRLRGESMPSDDWVMDKVAEVSDILKEHGFDRYEISNYAKPGRECRHNMAVWRGEDYIGLGEGAHGRIGRYRTISWGLSPASEAWGQTPEVEEVTEERDRLERTIFRLRTREGLEAGEHPEWRSVLERYVEQGALTVEGTVYRLTRRGAEICDSILADLI